MAMITKGMSFAELLKACPGAGEVLFKSGLHRIGCHLSPMESIEEGCRAHGLSESQIDALIKELNKKKG